MARLSPPINSTQCNCGINIRRKEMILDENPFELNTSYLLCPKCKLALFRIDTDCSDKTQKPIITVTQVESLDRRIFISVIRETRNRPY